MAHSTTTSILSAVFKPSLQRLAPSPPSFLIPSIASAQSTSFSTSHPSSARKDGNPMRGMSALRRTGVRVNGKLQKIDPSTLPQPVRDPRRRSAVQVNEKHGLYNFFNRAGEALYTPEELTGHGRAWTVQELRLKDWEDMWKLWWVCIMERNRISTFLEERERMGGNLIGKDEADQRLMTIKRTQKAIRHVLTERWYAWDNARWAAMEDPEVNLSANPELGEKAYTPLGESVVQQTIQGTASSTQSVSELPPPTEGPSNTTEARV